MRTVPYAKEEEVRQPSFHNPWTLEEYPMLADWVREIDEPLDAIAEAIRKPIFFFPLLQDKVSVESGKPMNLVSVLLPDVQLAREIARLFQARATYRIGQGNIDGAIDDKLAMHRFGRQVMQTGSMVPYLVGISIEGMANAIPVGANPEHPLTEQQIRRLLAGLDALPPRVPLTETFENERYYVLSFVQDFNAAHTQEGKSFSQWHADVSAWTGWNSFHRLPFFAIHPRSINWNVAYRRTNEIYDAAIISRSQEKYDSIVDEIRNESLWQSFCYLLTPDGRGTALSKMFTSLLLPATFAFEEAVQRGQCVENVQRLTLAILLYQCEHGKLPDDNWAVQIEPYLGEDAEKYFSCPSNPSPRGETRYMLLQYGDALPANPHTLLLIELADSVPFNEAVKSVDELLELVLNQQIVQERRECCGRVTIIDRVVNGNLNPHNGGGNAGSRSGAAYFLSDSTEKAELLRLLGREEE